MLKAVKNLLPAVSRLFAAALLPALVYSNALKAQPIPELIYFKFNSATGGNVPNDAQPATRVSTQGTLSGATVGGAGLSGTALQGNGGTTASNSIDANWATNLSGPWTVFLWMKGFTNTLSSNYIFGGSGGSSFRAFTGSGLVSGAGNILVRGTGMTDVPINNVFDANGTAVAVHIVYDPTTPAIRAYVNGTLVNTVAQSASMVLTGTDFRVGGQAASNGIPSGSLIDEFRLYNRALGASEIAATWNIELNSGPPCPRVAAINVTTYNSTSVNFQWPAVTGSQGYEYAVDQNPVGAAGTPSQTVATSALVTGLTPATQYYIHVRNKCTGNGISQWVDSPLMTYPPCALPGGFTVTSINSTSAAFSWTPPVTGVVYEYLVNQDKNAPTVPGTPTVTPNGSATGLTEGQTYYVHIRVRCLGNDSSGWYLDSFYTPVICRAPDVQFDHISSSRAVAYWTDVLTGVSYEYVLNQSAAIPTDGIRIYKNSVLLPYLDPKTEHYFHIRSYCSDRGQKTTSEWKSYMFKTHGVNVDDITGDVQQLTVYPNPAKDKVTINITGWKQGTMLQVTDMNGKVLENIAVQGETTTADIGQYPDGMYFIRYINERNTHTIKLLKQ